MRNLFSPLGRLNRREIFRRGGLLALPAFWQRRPAVAAPPAPGLQIGPDIYRSIGIRPLINCRGTLTIVGGSLELPEVRAAKEAAAQNYVHLDEMMDAMSKHKAVRLDANQVAALTKAAFVAAEGGKLIVNKDLLGQDAAVLAKHVGLSVPADTELLFGETDESNPFVDHEQMMPFVPFTRVKDVDTGIALAKKYEHGFRHTSVIHSRNLDTITRMGRELDTTLYIQNGPSVAGLGLGGEGFLSYSIATPTGEGVTSPLTFTRQRRSTTVGSMRVF